MSAENQDELNPLGQAAATARAVLGYSIEGAADRLGIPATILEEAESGSIEINDELKAMLEDCYGVELSSLVKKRPEYAPRTPMAYDAAQGILRVGMLGVRFRVGLDDNDALLRGFSSAVRRQRQLPPSVPLQLRKADMPVLASLLDLDDPELDERAQFWFGQTPQTAQSFRTMLRLSRSPDQAAAADASSQRNAKRSEAA